MLCAAALAPKMVWAELSEDVLKGLVQPPYTLMSRDQKLSAWKLKDVGGDHAGYIFESGELVDIPGFAGGPMNLLISIDLAGDIIDVVVLHQNEPVFVSGIGIGPLNDFLRQYRGKSVTSNIKVAGVAGGAIIKERATSANIYVDGVTKATASVRIVNEIILSAAIKILQGSKGGVVMQAAATPRKDLFEEASWDKLLALGMVKRLRLLNKDVEKAFANSLFSDRDEEALDNPDALYADFVFADIGVPSIAKNLINDEDLRVLYEQLGDFEEPILVMVNGRHRIVGPEFIRNTVPDLLFAKQRGFPVNIRDADADITFKPSVPKYDQVMVFRIDRRFGFDPATPWSLGIRVLRKRGFFQPDVGIRDFAADYSLPERFFSRPVVEKKEPPWVASWRERSAEIGGLIVLFSVLGLALARQRQIVGWPKTFLWGRRAFLASTLFFIGWHAQGQLSIVNVLAVLKAAWDGSSFVFLMYDPITLVLWAFVLITLVLWGRGTFCGWLCPFGALQDFIAQAAERFKLPQIRLSRTLDKKLVLVKYGVLAILIGAAIVSSGAADVAVEIEPFKTAITLMFVRDWHYVAYAVVLLALSAVLFKGFCRYLCPLGAFLAVLGRLRLLDWIERRSACGAPCQLCAARCQYEAINRKGEIIYAECFQCLDCVAIYEDERRCPPLASLLKKKEKLDAS
jgi:NosR/NirI family transcriptional regulator, nitrous oxide reductase regulator